MRAYLSRPCTDWNEIYLTLASSELHDPRFYAENFGFQPTRHVYKALEFAMERERERANANSVATARLGQIVQVAASMGKAKAKLTDYLPYEVKKRANETRITLEAALTIRTLIKQRQIPLSVASVLIEDIRNCEQLN